tara:strand:- start:9180 stop:10451 length:1272 start_codon:yes stop_codon:yes gene_type:complete
MRYIWLTAYNLIIYPLFFVLTLFLVPFNKKIRLGFFGRIKSRKKLLRFKEKTSFSKHYWFHVSSHGEYQQVQSIIAELKKDNIGIIVSFFSPSGFNNVNDDNIDCKIYLPFDFLISLYRSLKIVKPSKFIIASYDVWPNVISICKILGIKTLLVSLRIHSDSFKISFIGRSLYKAVYAQIDQIFTVSSKDLSNLKKIINNERFMAMGNPRFDMAHMKSDDVSIKLSLNERTENKIFLFASLWPEDHKILFPDIFDLLRKHSNSKIVLVPHELSENIIDYYKMLAKENNLSHEVIDKYIDMRTIESDIVIVNAVGILYKLYWQSYISYVGGGFSSGGIHNIMEPAVASNPVIFGKNYSNSNFLEANQLLNSSAAFSVNSSENLMNTFKNLSDKDSYLNASSSSKRVIENNLGSTKKLMSVIVDG